MVHLILGNPHIDMFKNTSRLLAGALKVPAASDDPKGPSTQQLSTKDLSANTHNL